MSKKSGEHITLYNMVVFGEILGIFTTEEESWALSPAKGTHIVSSVDECKYAGTKYAIKYDINEFPIKKLLRIMYEELSAKEVKRICAYDHNIEKYFLAYLEGVEFRNEIKKVKRKANNAAGIAALGMIL